MTKTYTTIVTSQKKIDQTFTFRSWGFVIGLFHNILAPKSLYVIIDEKVFVHSWNFDWHI